MQLGAGKICIQNKAGFFAEHLGIALHLQQIAIFRSAATLPHDSLINRATGHLIPHDGGFALVGDANASDIGGSNIQLAHGLVHQA